MTVNDCIERAGDALNDAQADASTEGRDSLTRIAQGWMSLAHVIRNCGTA